MSNQTATQYLSTWPSGEDLTGLKPQKRICDAIVNHIIDYDGEQYEGGKMPRVVGLEGKWGGGKSNVIKQLYEHSALNDHYCVIEFDAWAYQEDEYRVSLMEYITSKLSQEQSEKKVKYKSLLTRALSQYEYEDKKFEPHASRLLIGALFTIAFTALFGFILEKYPDTDFYRLCRAVFIVFPWIILASFALWNRQHINDLLIMFENNIRNGATVRNVYTRAPSVSDMRNWMDKVSKVCGKKLIVVIDNMDRLPVEKLKKLWSVIHIFANNEDMENAWIVIPYDEHRLKDVFGDGYKQYLIKTIPVTFNVAEPIVSDERDIFDGLYEQAFGQKEPNLSYIRALFAITKENFSIRDIIYFINSMVTIKRQFEDFSLISIALYVVLEDEIRSHPYKALLEDRFASKYSTVIPIGEDNRREVAAIVYHVSKDDAMQVVYENAIGHVVMGDDKLPEEVKDKPTFYKVLTDYCSKVDEQTYEGYIDVLDEVETRKNREEFKKEIEICWQHIIQFYLGYDIHKVPWVSSERIKKMLSNCTKAQIDDVLYTYSFDLLSNRNTSGADIYKYCTELDNLVNQFNGDWESVFGTVSLPPSKFKEYLDEAKDQYSNYPVVCEPNSWVDFCTNMIENAAGNLLNLCYMGNDDGYDFTKLKEKAEQLIGDSGNDERNSLNAYKIYRKLSNKPVNVKPARRIAVSDVINTFDHVDNDPVFIALRMYHNKLAYFDESLLPQVSEEMLYLMSPLEIFHKCIRENINSFMDVTKYIIQNKLLCDIRLQANALDVCMPLANKGIVTKSELEEYIEACHKDADKRGLSEGVVIYV